MSEARERDADSGQTDAEIVRLEELLSSESRIDALEYASLLQRIGRRDPKRLLELATSSYQFGLKQAFLEGDAAAFVAIADAGTTMLDALGLHRLAIARLDQAVQMVGAGNAGYFELVRSRSHFEAHSGRTDEARSSLAQVEDAGITDPLLNAGVASTRCVLMSGSAAEALRAAVVAQDLGADGHASSLMAHLTPFNTAIGAVQDAEYVARRLLGYATGVGHRARQIDAEAALIAIAARRDRSDASDELLEEAARLYNNHPMWKLIVSRYRQSVIRGEGEAATRAHELLLTHHDWMNPGYWNSFAGLDAYRAALFDESAVVELALPDPPTLLSVDNVLASAEAVAIGGTLSAAADWLVWLEAELPAHVVTSMEWPACRARVEALLLLRVGQREEALARLQTAVRCCEERGDTIEAEIGRVQLATLTRDEHSRVLGVGRLDEVGIDAECFISAAARMAERAELAGPDPLTMQEARVLGRLARGLTHREIEADLGLAARGAAGSLSASYAKLGANGRIEAVRIARERLIA